MNHLINMHSNGYICDRLVIGAGFYGLYSALFCGRLGQKVIVLEKEPEAFTRASYINQARVHMGYHYPRSISTAIKSDKYFERFCDDFAYCIYKDFNQIYATSSNFSWTNAGDFIQFCRNANIPCSKVDQNEFIKYGMCDGAFTTREYIYDAQILKSHLLKEMEDLSNVKIVYKHSPEIIERRGDLWFVKAQDMMLQTPFILNTTYASVNEVLKITDGGVFHQFKIKYEKCEIILCNVNESLQNLGITVMDGPFFSIMPFGKTGLHSLTSVTFTPHETSYDTFATFPCQRKQLSSTEDNITTGTRKIICTPACLNNCNECTDRPNSAWSYMSQLAKKYLKDDFEFTYHSSLFSMKPILVDSEIDDSRPTVIRKHCSSPTMISVLSGKINTIYDVEEVLFDG